MPIVETISIINKSGKVVSTSKHLVNIFKDAKEAYQEKKAEIRAEILQKHEEKQAQKMKKNLRIQKERLEEVRSEGSRHSHRHRSRKSTEGGPIRPALTERNLVAVTEGSVASSRRSSRHGGERPPRSPRTHRSPGMYQAPYFENADISKPDLTRRHTDFPLEHDMDSRAIYAPPHRTMSSPNIGGDDIDMHLAYGDLPPPLPDSAEKQIELQGLMSKLDKLMLEAQCIQHSASSIISSLQENPQAMAAVALTLAEISNLLTKLSPGVLATLKGGFPAIFALLASPQFLIAGGVAVGVTIVMFGGYKIIKKIQANAELKKEAGRMDEALPFEGEFSGDFNGDFEMGSIESWRRGIADVAEGSVGTSVDGEFITPEAARVRKERIRERKMEERRSRGPEILDSESGSTVRRKAVSSKSKTVVGESTVKAEKKEKEKEKEKKVKKPNALVVLFKKGAKSEKEKEKVVSKSHKPKMLEM